MHGHGLVSQARRATVLLVDLEESVREFELSLVPRTWPLVARLGGRFHFQCQKDHTFTLRLSLLQELDLLLLAA